MEGLEVLTCWMSTRSYAFNVPRKSILDLRLRGRLCATDQALDLSAKRQDPDQVQVASIEVTLQRRKIFIGVLCLELLRRINLGGNLEYVEDVSDHWQL